MCQGKEEGLFHLQIWELAVPKFLHLLVFKVQQISHESNKGRDNEWVRKKVFRWGRKKVIRKTRRKNKPGKKWKKYESEVKYT